MSIKNCALSVLVHVQMNKKATGMPKGPNGQRRPADAIGRAVHIAQIATGEIEETKLEQPAKRKSGLAGSKARSESLTAEERSEVAKKAAAARWG